MPDNQYDLDSIAAQIDNEGFEYWLLEYYDRSRCLVLGESTLTAFDHARACLNLAREAAQDEGLFD